jgi:hypothetical protein
MTDCLHCGLPVVAGCENHVQMKKRAPKAVKVERDAAQDQSIHPRVRNGRTVSPKVNTCKPKRAA